jgi:hypothetical protein
MYVHAPPGAGQASSPPLRLAQLREQIVPFSPELAV